MMTCIVVFVVLINVFINSKELVSKMVSIPFLLFSISLFLKNLFLILNKRKIALKFSKLLIIAFSIYYFGFLLYWNYVNIINRNYISLVFGILIGIGGGYIISRRFKKEK